MKKNKIKSIYNIVTGTLGVLIILGMLYLAGVVSSLESGYDLPKLTPIYVVAVLFVIAIETLILNRLLAIAGLVIATLCTTELWAYNHNFKRPSKSGKHLIHLQRDNDLSYKEVFETLYERSLYTLSHDISDN